MTRTTEEALRQLSKASAEKARHRSAVPDDPEAIGRRVAAEVFDEYLEASRLRKGGEKRR
ncbi:MAG: hypothetical protein KTV16_15850 [Acidimicrobiia bacterium]|nr:hypothetical protein [Acidimicrobiia bacterium]